MSALPLKAAPRLKSDGEVREKIPYLVHATRHIVAGQDEYITVIRCDGASFESADDSELNSWHRNLNMLSRSIADPRITIWSTLNRDEENSYPDGDYPPGFAADFNAKYADKVRKELLMVNQLYVTIVFRPQTSGVGRTLLKILKSVDDGAAAQEAADSLDYLEKVAGEVMSGLNRYEPERLGVYEHKGRKFSATKEFIGYLINGEWQRMPLTLAPIRDVVATTRPFFGSETIELRPTTGAIFGAMLGIAEYTSETYPGVLNDLLSAPFPFVLTQSFTFMTKQSAIFNVKVQRNRMKNTGDDAKSQIEEMDQLLDDIASNRVVKGHHHFTLFVKSRSMRGLEQNIQDAKTLLGDAGIVVAREDLALEAAFWAQLPGNFKYRPRLSPITSLNWAALAPLHNYPSGRLKGNHWGDALTTLLTDANTPYYFSPHASDPTEEDGGSRKDVADMLMLGPKGSGKTVVATTIATFLQKFGVTCVFFTKDRDSEIVVRALGGKYMAMKMGERTGANPFHLEPKPAVIQFWNQLVLQLVRRPITLHDEMEVQEAINWLAGLPTEKRRLGRLLSRLDNTDADSVHAHLKQWCYATREGEQDGIYAWVFDNNTDVVAEVVSGKYRTVGFDITDFLDHAVIRGPILFYLMYLVNGLIDGRRISIFIAEFWKPLADLYFAKQVKDWLKTIRKKNGFVVLDSQSPSDALNHPDARTLIEQTATKILFPNPEAAESEYCEGLSLSKREFMLIKEDLQLGSRKFLIKQGKNSVVAKLDLKGFDFYLAVLSARSGNIDLVNELIRQYGEDPENWMPHFKERFKKE